MAAFLNALDVQLWLRQLPTALVLVVLSETRHSFPRNIVMLVYYDEK